MSLGPAPSEGAVVGGGTMKLSTSMSPMFDIVPSLLLVEWQVEDAMNWRSLHASRHHVTDRAGRSKSGSHAIGPCFNPKVC